VQLIGHGNPFHEALDAVIMLMVLPETVWYSVVSDTADGRFLRVTCFSTRRPLSVSLRGLPLRGQAVVAPRRFHFTIIALTVDRGTSSQAEISRSKLVAKMASYDSATFSHWALY